MFFGFITSSATAAWKDKPVIHLKNLAYKNSLCEVECTFIQQHFKLGKCLVLLYVSFPPRYMGSFYNIQEISECMHSAISYNECSNNLINVSVFMFPWCWDGKRNRTLHQEPEAVHLLILKEYVYLYLSYFATNSSLPKNQIRKNNDTQGYNESYAMRQTPNKKCDAAVIGESMQMQTETIMTWYFNI